MKRRAFLVTAAGVCGAIALGETPGMVTIVEFGANGKPQVSLLRSPGFPV